MQSIQPFPYQGSKRKIADHILKYFPEEENLRIIEPFAGAGAVSIAAAIHNKNYKFLMNDTNIPLIKLWEMIIQKPEKLCESYQKYWKQQNIDTYKNIRDEFNKTQRPDLFLYLLARCVKAAIRYNSQGLFNQSPDKRRKGMNPKKMRSNILAISRLFRKRITFISKDYKEIINLVNKSDLLYMDPPYQGVCANKNPRYSTPIIFEEFVKFLTVLNKKNISYIVSYDGRTGKKTHGKILPKILNLTHIEINAGKSAQYTLIGKSEITYESLYLSPALMKRLSKNIYKDKQTKLVL
jgi:DNA adenine methylase